MKEFDNEFFEALNKKLKEVNTLKKRVLSIFVTILIIDLAVILFFYFHSNHHVIKLLVICFAVILLIAVGVNLFIDMAKQQVMKELDPFLEGARRIISRDINERKYARKNAKKNSDNSNQS